jgi:glutathione S-transferase
MQLVGRLLSPYVRRVAATLNLYGMAWEARPLSTLADGAAIRALNPLGRVPILILDDGEVLTESSAILDHLDELAGEAALTPRSGAERREVLRVTSLALGAADKAVAAYTETQRRPEAVRWAEGATALTEQAMGGFAAVEAMATGEHLCLGRLTQADVSAVVARDFACLVLRAAMEGRFPRLGALSARLNADRRIAATEFTG